MTASSAAARAELAPTGKLRAGINFQNTLLTAIGPNGEQLGVACDLVRELARRLDVPLEILHYKSAGSLADSVKTALGSAGSSFMSFASGLMRRFSGHKRARGAANAADDEGR